jgi:RNA polymerase sigma factor (sigma-70 family)
VYVFLKRDVFIKFVYRNKKKFYAYLNEVVRNARLTFLRDRKRKMGAKTVGKADPQKLLDKVTAKDLETICEEDRALVQTIRANVEEEEDAKTRQVFRMLMDDERSPKEVAELLGMTVPAVYQVKSRMLRKLREEFQRLSGDEVDRQNT